MQNRVDLYSYKQEGEKCLSELQKVTALMEEHGFNHKSAAQ